VDPSEVNYTCSTSKRGSSLRVRGKENVKGLSGGGFAGLSPSQTPGQRKAGGHRDLSSEVEIDKQGTADLKYSSELSGPLT